MPDKVFKGKINAKIIEVRFALSGKTSRISKKTGDSVRKGELLASLDKSSLQTNLDRQLADYEKTRADFEIFNLKMGEPQDALNKYLKTEKQAQLNASVKEVELAKIKLDQADLFSPIDGIILNDNNLVPNLYVTSSSNPFEIVDTSSFFFEIEVKQEEISFFTEPKIGKINILGLKKQDSAKTNPVLTDGKRFYLKIDIPDKKDLLLGMEGKITFGE